MEFLVGSVSQFDEVAVFFFFIQCVWFPENRRKGGENLESNDMPRLMWMPWWRFTDFLSVSLQPMKALILFYFLLVSSEFGRSVAFLPWICVFLLAFRF